MRRWLTRALTVPAAALALALLSGCAELSMLSADSAAGSSAAAAEAAVRAGLAAGVPLLRPVVLGTLPHDPGAWTEGLEEAGGLLYESTGLVGRSQLRELDPTTGRLLRSAPVPDGRYGEGVTVLGDRIWQLTYTDHVALPWDRRTLRPGPSVPYPGEGWGLCHTRDRTAAHPAGDVLVASDGTDRLRLLAEADLHPLGSLPVRIAGRPLPSLNELECLPGAGRGTGWANVFETDYLARIDLTSGAVTAVVDASSLVPPAVRDQSGSVLNGIAAVPGTDQFLLTGKFWPVLYRVRFVPQPPR